MKSTYLSKSDFKAASSCPVKLYYKKKGYPSAQQHDDFLELLADGGFIIGEWAKLLHPDGVEIKSLRISEATPESDRLLKQDTVTLFEPVIRHDKYLARIDVLVKRGNRVDLIEVKSKSINSEEFDGPSPFRTKKGKIDSGWREYLEDVAFQTLTAELAHPDWQVTPYLLLPDKAKAVQEDGLHKLFRIERVPQASGRDEIQIICQADHNRVSHNDFLTKFDVSEEVDELMDEVTQRAAMLAGYLNGEVTKPTPQIGHQCKGCEYRLDTPPNQPNGFKECWEKLADPDPHLFDLYRLTDKISEPLIQAGNCGLCDIGVDSLSERQRLQVECMQFGNEYFAPELRDKVDGAAYPLHFIDFEATRMALPYHAGTPPYDLVAFQWSCHTVDHPGAQPRHSEWLNTQDQYPNIEFARSLMHEIGGGGTLMVWSPYERSALKHVHETLEGNAAEAQLCGELGDLLEHYEDRAIDLCKWTRKYYYHPDMKGSNSIKVVLPAIWNNNSALHTIPWFQPYYATESGKVVDPYKQLPPIEILGKMETIQEGTGAMRAYDAMLYGPAGQDPAAKKAWEDLLLQYCKLDTLAMVIIWEHWRNNC